MKWSSAARTTLGRTQGLAIFLIAMVVILAILLYGFAWGHWFNFGGTVNVVTSPGGGGASPMPSISPSK